MVSIARSEYFCCLPRFPDGVDFHDFIAFVDNHNVRFIHIHSLPKDRLIHQPTKLRSSTAFAFLLSISIYQKACASGDANACNNLGVMYKRGEGVSEDDEKAVKLFQKACDGGDATGCYNLGKMYYNGVGVSQDDGKAKELFQKACKLGYSEACR